MLDVLMVNVLANQTKRLVPVLRYSVVYGFGIQFASGRSRLWTQYLGNIYMHAVCAVTLQLV